MQKKLDIMHIDMDAFFLSIELNTNPQYKGKPCFVAGNSESRGVVLSASYEARAFGIRAGMAVKVAKSRCPHAVILPSHHNLYGEISEKVMQVFHKYSPALEVASIDEAYIDTKGTEALHGSPLEIAKKIKKEIWELFSLSCSVGISENKLLAKIAANMKKPDGLTILSRDDFMKTCGTFPVDKITGIGQKTKKELENLGINIIDDLRKMSIDSLRSLFGKYGDFLYESCRGIDDSPVVSEGYEPKSIGQETTLEHDTVEKELLQSVLLTLSGEVGRRLRKKEKHCRTVTLKIRYFDFETHTAQKKLAHPTDLDEDIYLTALELFEKQRIRPVRLLGVTANSISDKGTVSDQPGLFDKPPDMRIETLNVLREKIKDKYGEDAIMRARSLLTKKH